jgi:tetratricopeptide (TPR) repeat protein
MKSAGVRDNHGVACCTQEIMFSFIFYSSLLLGQLQKFEVAGEVLSPARQRLEWAEIESVDRRFVDYAGIDVSGRFTFKDIPEGLYKLTTGGAGRREEQRTIEVRPAFADPRGRIQVRIEARDRSSAENQVVSAARMAVSPEAVQELRRAQEARGDVEKARQHLQWAIEISPDFDEALNNLGTYYYRDGRFETAASLFERALKANPGLFQAQVNLGGALISLGNYPRALEENLKAVGRRPGDGLAQAQTGQALFYLKRYDEAIPYLEEARRLDPMSFALPGLLIAQIRQLQGRTGEAIGEYQEFLRMHPKHPNTAFVERQLRSLSGETGK